MSVHLLFPMGLGPKSSSAKEFRESLCLDFKAGDKFLFTSVSSAFAYKTKYSLMSLRPRMAQKSDK